MFQHEIFVMLGARVTTGTIMTSQVNVVSVRGVGKNPSTSGLGIFAPHLEPRGELIAQYRPPMSFRYKINCKWPSRRPDGLTMLDWFTVHEATLSTYIRESA